jgi:hypothetical protein
MFHSSQVLGVEEASRGMENGNTGDDPMTRLLPKFFAKKALIQVNDIDMQAQAALQMRVSRMLQHHVAAGDILVSPQILQSA